MTDLVTRYLELGLRGGRHLDGMVDAARKLIREIKKGEKTLGQDRVLKGWWKPERVASRWRSAAGIITGITLVRCVRISRCSIAVSAP